MRRLTTTLAIGAMLLGAVAPALARTAAPLCRQRCGPRVAEQCAALGGRAFRTCRRGLVRACRRTTPDVACATTADLTRELGDRLVTVGAGATDVALTLCGDGRFTSHESTPGADATGTWSVRLADGVLAIELDAGATPPQRLRLERDGAGGLLVDGTRAGLAGAAASCGVAPVLPPPLPPPPPPVPPAPTGPDAVLAAISQAISDHTLASETITPSLFGDLTDKRELTLCGSGRFGLVQTHINRTSETTTSRHGTWSLEALGGSPILDLVADDGSTTRFALALVDAGHVLLGDTEATIGDVGGSCAAPPPAGSDPDAVLAHDLTQAVAGKAFLIVTPSSPSAPSPSSELGLCDSGRFLFTRLGVETRGTWSVVASGGIAALELTRDGGGSFAELRVERDGSGDLLVNGQAGERDDPAFVAQACQG